MAKARSSSSAAALHDAGLARYREGALDEAERLLHQALEAEPRNATYRYNYAQLLQQLGRYERAAEEYARVIRTEPGSAVDALCNGGLCLLQMGRHAEAERYLRRALARAPDAFAAHHNLGLALYRQGRHAEALDALRRALVLDPRSSAASNDLALVLLAAGELAGAERHARSAALAEAALPEARHTLASVLLAAGRFDEAVAALGALLRDHPAFPGALNTLALTHHRAGRHALAAEMARRALARGADADLANTLGLALKYLGDYAAAEASFRAAIAADAKHAEARFNLAAMLLARGERAGWAEYAWRPQRKALRARPAPARWLEARHLPGLRGKRVLLLGEQGLGDEIFLFRFVPRLMERGAVVSYAGDSRIEALLDERLAIGIAQGMRAAVPDYAVPLGDLPGLLDAGDPAPSLRLVANPLRVERLGEALRAAGPAPYIGVTWAAGGVREAWRAAELGMLHKSIAPDALGAALGGIRATLVVLQRNAERAHIESFSNAAGQLALDWSAANGDLEEMLALLSVLDDYVGVSNTNMHLRAATGKTAHVLVQSPPEWRWGLAGERSPWFAGFRLYRQRPREGWGAALESLRRDLEA